MKTYEISEGGKSITCLGCGSISFHPQDVEHKYCVHCHVFHEDIWPEAREWFVKQRKDKH